MQALHFILAGRLIAVLSLIAMLRTVLRGPLDRKKEGVLVYAALFVLVIGDFLIFVRGLYSTGFYDTAFPFLYFYEAALILLLSFAARADEYIKQKISFLKPGIGHGVFLAIPVIFYFALSNAGIARAVLSFYNVALLLFLVGIGFSRISGYLTPIPVILFSLSSVLYISGLVKRFDPGYEGEFSLLYIITMISGFASVISLVRNQEYERKLENSKRELEVINKITRRLNSVFELDTLLDKSIDYITGFLKAKSAAIYLKGRRDFLEARAVRGMFPPVERLSAYTATKSDFLHRAIKQKKVKVGEGIIGRVFETGEAVIRTDVLGDKTFLQTLPEVIMVNTYMVMPLKREGETYGVVMVVNKGSHENFSDEDFSFMSVVIEQVSLAIYNSILFGEMQQKKEAEADLKAASQIQRSLIPAEPPSIPSLDISSFYLPAKTIGGDFYDFFEVNETSLGVMMADVSGKGTPGAMVMSIFKTMTRMLVGGRTSSSDVIRTLNESIPREIEEKSMFVTACYMIIDFNRKSVNFTRAGHNPLFIYRSAEAKIEAYRPKGIALGMIKGDVFVSNTEEQEIVLAPGDKIFLYTDGLTEEFNESGELYGEERLIEFLTANSRRSSGEIIELLVDSLKEFRGENLQHDDTAIISIGFR